MRSRAEDGDEQPDRGHDVSKAGRVRIEGVVKRHGTTTVLHDVDLDIAAGEFFVLLGPSGSGKTTTCASWRASNRFRPGAC